MSLSIFERVCFPTEEEKAKIKELVEVTEKKIEDECLAMGFSISEIKDAYAAHAKDYPSNLPGFVYVPLITEYMESEYRDSEYRLVFETESNN